MAEDIKVGGEHCVVKSFGCYSWDPCRHCREEVRHQLAIRRERERNESSARTNKAVAELVVEHPGAVLGGLAIMAGIAGIAQIAKNNREKKAAQQVIDAKSKKK